MKQENSSACTIVYTWSPFCVAKPLGKTNFWTLLTGMNIPLVWRLPLQKLTAGAQCDWGGYKIRLPFCWKFLFQRSNHFENLHQKWTVGYVVRHPCANDSKLLALDWLKSSEQPWDWWSESSETTSLCKPAFAQWCGTHMAGTGYLPERGGRWLPQRPWLPWVPLRNVRRKWQQFGQLMLFPFPEHFEQWCRLFRELL